MVVPPKSATRRTPQQERSLAIVESLVMATSAVLGSEGPGTTTNRIAERAGVSVGSLYRYFPSKDALFDAAAERYAARLVEVVAGIDRGGSASRPLSEVVRDTMTALIAVEDEFPGLGPAINRMRFAGRAFPSMDAMEEQGERMFIAHLASAWPSGGRPVARVASVGIRTFIATVRVTLAYRPREFARPAFVDEIVTLLSGYIGQVEAEAEQIDDADSGGPPPQT